MTVEEWGERGRSEVGGEEIERSEWGRYLGAGWGYFFFLQDIEEKVS